MPSRKAKSPKNKSLRNKQPNTALRDLFRGVIPTTWLGHIIREAAQQEGWTPDWSREGQKLLKAKAGAKSGISRKALAQMRQSFVRYARTQINPEHRLTPYAKKSFGELRKLYKNLLAKDANDPDPVLAAMHSALSPADRKSLRQASDDTLLKDLKAIRRSHGVRR